MKTILYIIPYFGKLRDDFPLWLKTCEYNPTIDWLIITDDQTDYNYPSNVKVVYSKFQDIVDRFTELVDFNISLNNPYRLCDFKPAYGEAFKEYIEGYDFWGYCDMDLLWGNIRDFLTDEILTRYEKIGFLGHSTLYHNTLENNKRWRCMGCSEINYKEAFTSLENQFFDERSINEIYQTQHIEIYNKQIFADLTDYHYNFYLTNVERENAFKNKRQIFYWNEGILYRKYIWNRKVYTDEFMYIHFLKRKMKLELNVSSNRWMIIPNKITDQIQVPTYKFVKKNSKPHWFKYFIILFWEKKHKITPLNLVKFLYRRTKKYYILKHKNSNLNDYKM